MDKILPKNYIFDPQYIYNPSGMNSRLLDRMRVWQVWLILGAIFLIGFLLIKNSKTQRSVYALKLKTSGEGLFVLGTVLTIFCISFSTNVINPTKFNQSLRRPYNENSYFMLKFVSNLAVRQDKTDYPGTFNQTKGYPYRFYVVDIENINNNPTYLGHVKNNKIYFDKANKAGKLFSKYYYYIKKHHLAKKFKNNFEFEFSNNIKNSTLSGDQITLGARLTKKKKIKIYDAGKYERRKKLDALKRYRSQEYKRYMQQHRR